MKKLLLGTAAAALAISANAAFATDYKNSGNQWTASIGGSFKVGLGYVDDGADSDYGFVRNSELKLQFGMVADNGLTWGVKFEVETDDGIGGAVWEDKNGDGVIQASEVASTGVMNVDEAVMWVEGSFGRVEVGEEDGAGDKFMGSGIVGCEFVSVVDECGMLDSYSVYAHNIKGGDTGDALKVTYYTPNFSGFQAGISFVPNVDVENGTAVPLDGHSNGIEIGAQYNGDFDGFGLTIGGGWVSDTSGNAADDGAAAGGVAISVSGFSLGLNYGWAETDDTSTLGLSGNYKTGPWTFGGAALVNIDSDTAAKDGSWGLSGEVAYALAPGVAVGTGLAYWDTDVAGADEAFEASLWMGLSF